MYWVTVGSLILNVILFLLIFFRSTLNEIVKEWWVRQREKKERRRVLLKKLYSHLEVFPNYYFLWGTFAHVRIHARHPDEIAQARDFSEENSKRCGAILTFIRDNRFDFAARIQALLQDFERAIQFQSEPTLEAFDTAMDRLSSVLPPLRQAILAEIRE